MPARSSSTVTLSRPASPKAPKPTAPARPARRVAAPTPEVPDVLKGVTAPPVPETPRAARLRKLAEAKAAAANPFAAAAIAKGPLSVGVKPSVSKEPKVNVNESKNDLAILIVRAAGKAIAAAKPGTFPGIDDPLALASRWLHYLPVGATWPTGDLPVPARSEWKSDGTRV